MIKLSLRNQSADCLWQSNGTTLYFEIPTPVCVLARNDKGRLYLDAERIHDLRHSYAVVSLKSGDNVKTVQEILGHATSAFTLDIYGHVTEKMKKDSADRMQKFIQSIRS